MLDDNFKKSAMEKVTTMSANELKKAFKEIGSESETNEEWFNSLSTEEKAKYIAKAMFFYDSQFGLTMVEALRKSVEYEDGLNETIEHDVVEWLKQPHKGD